MQVYSFVQYTLTEDGGRFLLAAASVAVGVVEGRVVALVDPLPEDRVAQLQQSHTTIA